MIFITMLLMGIVLGFAGTGGSGFIIGLLVALFGVPIHTALGTSIAAMALTALSGSVSHWKEGNASLKTGAAVGLFGAAGAYGGTYIARAIDPDQMIWLTSAMLFLSGALIWIRTRMKAVDEKEEPPFAGFRLWLLAAASGTITGALSGIFGIGSTPFIQLALLMLFGFPLRKAVGTTMLVILPIAVFGSLGFWQAGFLDGGLFLQVVAGTMIGSYVGAKFTKRAPRALLRTAMIMTPITGALLLLVHP